MRYSILVLLALAMPASASTPAAWAAEARDAARSCLAASGLAGARITGRPAVFDDRLPVDALLLSGRVRERWLHGRLTTRLCLYDRRNRRALTVEAPGWPAPLR